MNSGENMAYIRDRLPPLALLSHCHLLSSSLLFHPAFLYLQPLFLSLASFFLLVNLSIVSSYIARFIIQASLSGFFQKYQTVLVKIMQATVFFLATTGTFKSLNFLILQTLASTIPHIKLLCLEYCLVPDIFFIMY